MNREIVEILEKIVTPECFLELHNEENEHRPSPYAAHLTVREMKILNEAVKKAKAAL